MNPASSRRQLWTGPCGTDRVAPLIAHQGWNRWAAWIVPSDLARADLARRFDPATAPLPRIWTWPDLWDAIADRSESPPARLAPAAQRALIIEAIDQARRGGEIPLCERVADTPGFRRQVSGRIAGWTRAERHLNDGAAPPADPIDAELWSIYLRYRTLLAGLGAEDPEGFASWASHALAESSRSSWPDLDAVIFVEAAEWNATRRRALDWMRSEIRFLAVTLPYDEDPALAEPYRVAAVIRSDFIDRGFAEFPVLFGPDRPAGLVAFAREVFRPDAFTRPVATDAAGLDLAGIPRGEAEGHLAARQVRDAIGAGVPAHRILVLARHWNEEVEASARALSSWQLPVRVLRPIPLRAKPAVAALRLAMTIAARGWEAAEIAGLLRHQLIRPSDPEAPPDARHVLGAQAILESRAFRDRKLIRLALARHAEIETERPDSPGGWALQRRAHRAKAGVAALDWLATTLAPWEEGPKTFAAHIDALFAVASALGLDAIPEDREALDAYRAALEDHEAIRDALGRGEEALDFAPFVTEADGLARDLIVEPSLSQGEGAVLVTTLNRVGGMHPLRTIVLGLTEGTFPLADAADSAAAETAEEENAAITPWAREAFAFLRLADLAGESLTLVVPSTDANGEDLEPAGFAEDVRERFADNCFAPPVRQLDPADLGELAGSPVEARVRAMHLALHGDAGPLAGLIADPRHREPLRDTEAALLMSRQRMGSRRFGAHDGMLRSPWARAEIARRFRVDQRVLSPTQLESYILCPFQFFARFVLGLESRDDPDELAEDRPEQGRLIHLVLERLHRDLMDDPEAIEAIEQRLDDTLARIWEESDPPQDSDLHSALARIGRGRLDRLTRRYLRQFRKYRETLGKDARSTGFEVEFGRKPIALARGFNELTVGHGEQAVALQGVIDRIDLIGTGDGPKFRIIDYKTGHCPTGSEVQRGEQIQLPLYALATERLNLLEPRAEFGDVGYWAVGGDGFKTIKIKDWPDFRTRFESFLIAVGERMREGAFPIATRDEDCTGFCEYRGVCRVQQVRLAAKTWEDQPQLAPEKGK